ncbi:peptidoglycan-binding protein [Paragemmobacter straminiformis]|uniref:Peptidoglycan-binding protein n=1 Tax=Paragemmobacter straminiformis TaxID=2045119 RepID=A0A842IDP6_9RHOB|nr:trypsin-like peptidase domain-containing protein [Gemmobacter straminiformis]MBC2837681.1 peptidoglycan-binding protein [Gemmobacter straminiformis]
MMRQAFSLFVLLFTLVTAASAQDARWIQIEAQPTLAAAEDRARAWEGLFQDVNGFSTGSGWYVIALGPYTDAQAEARRAELRGENLIPGDSFVSDGASFGPMFWPVGATTPGVPEPDAPLADAPASDVPAPDATAPDTAANLTSEPDQPAFIDETPDEARASEAALSQTDREDLQRALMWFGFYDSTVDGAFGRGTRASMAAWQSAQSLEPTGVLTTRQRADLLSAYRAEETAFGFQTVTENEAGIEASLPLALVAFDHYEPPFVHFTAKDGGDTRIILISQPGEEAALAGLFDTLQTLQIVPASGPRANDGKSFTLRGESADRITEAYATTARGMVKGWLVSWNPATAPDMQRVLTMLKTSFRPIGDRALDPGLVPLSAGSKAGLLSGLEIKRPRLSRTGFYVDAQGTVLTTAEATAQCGRITLDTRTEARVLASDTASGLVLLKPASPLSPPASAAFTPATAGAEIAVSGYSYEDTLPAPVLTYGILEATTGLDGEATLNRLTLAALAGDAGGPVLTASGAVAGVLLPKGTGARQLPEGVAFAAPASAIAPLLQQAGITPATATDQTALTPQDLSARAQGMTVLVSCWE